MARTQIASLPRLIAPDDLMQWARELVENLQGIFLGKVGGVGLIDGNAILDGSLGTDKLLATAGGLWNGNPVTYPVGVTQVIQLPNVWLSSGGVALSNNEIHAPAFGSWAIVTFSCHFSDANAVNTHIALEENDGSGYFPRARWTGGLPIDCNISMLVYAPANCVFRATILVDATEPAKTISNYPAPFLTMGIIGQAVEPT